MYYEEVIAQCMEVVARAEQPLPKPCGKTKGCRLAGGCQECFAELLKGTAKYHLSTAGSKLRAVDTTGATPFLAMGNHPA